MAGVGRRNSAFKFYVNGSRARDLHGLTGVADQILSAYDTSVIRAVVGLKRRVLPVTSREVRKEYGIQARALQGRFRVEDGRRGKTGGDYLSLWASTRRVPLLDFQGRWGGRRAVGATASVEAGARKTYPGAFIAVIQGRRAIRVRRRDEVTGKRHGRGPVRMLYGPSAFEMVSGLDHRGSIGVRSAVMETLRTFYIGELRRQFKLGGV